MNMANNPTKPLRDKGDRKGWPTIDKAKHIKLSQANKVNVYNPITREVTKVSLSW